MEYIGKIVNDKKLLESKAKIIPFGAGNGIIPLLHMLKKMNVSDRIIYICDNDCNRQGKEIEGIKICSLNEAMKYDSDTLYIVYNRFCKEISEQLIKEGITNIHLIRE